MSNVSRDMDACEHMAVCHVCVHSYDYMKRSLTCGGIVEAILFEAINTQVVHGHALAA
jgi:hypothetical protein